MVATRLDGEPCGFGEFAVPSLSAPGSVHTVIWVTETACWCDCVAFSRKQTCRHVAAVADAIEAEARAFAATVTPEQRQAAAGRLNEIAALFER